MAYGMEHLAACLSDGPLSSGPIRLLFRLETGLTVAKQPGEISSTLGDAASQLGDRMAYDFDWRNVVCSIMFLLRETSFLTCRLPWVRQAYGNL